VAASSDAVKPGCQSADTNDIAADRSPDLEEAAARGSLKRTPGTLKRAKVP
jgi:hypothetical protein